MCACSLLTVHVRARCYVCAVMCTCLCACVADHGCAGTGMLVCTRTRQAHDHSLVSTHVHALLPSTNAYIHALMSLVRTSTSYVCAYIRTIKGHVGTPPHVRTIKGQSYA
jgi:hypothetical protein